MSASPVLFVDGPLAGRSIGYWMAADVIEGPWPGRYEIAHVVNPDDAELRVEVEYRYNPHFGAANRL